MTLDTLAQLSNLLSKKTISLSPIQTPCPHVLQPPLQEEKIVLVCLKIEIKEGNLKPGKLELNIIFI